MQKGEPPLQQKRQSLQLIDLLEEGFIRVHQSHLVNKHQVLSYEKSDGGYLLMNDGAQVSISRMRKENVLKILSGKKKEA